jgi:hypothetical protein
MPDTIWRNKGKVNSIAASSSKTSPLPANHPLPEGMRIVEVPPYKKSGETALDCMSQLFDRMAGSEYLWVSYTTTTLFERRNPPGSPIRLNRLSVAEAVALPELTKQDRHMLVSYFDAVCGHFNVRKRTKLYKQLFDEVSMSVLRYKSSSPSMHCHLDNVSGGTGPIVTVNVAASRIAYDCIPVYFRPQDLGGNVPFRVMIEPHEAVVMDGEMRFAWSHCLPKGYKMVGHKYTIKFVMPEFGKNMRVVCNNFFDEDLTVSMN